MKLYDFVPNKQTIIDEAFKHPVMKIKPRAANPYPSIDDALKATLNAIENNVIMSVAEDITPALDAALLDMILMDGDHEDSDNKDEWESALDDKVEAAIEKYVPICSADWLGNHTINSGLHEPDGVKKFAHSLGREVYKQMTYGLDKSPAKIMSAAGVVQKDVEARLALHNQPVQKETNMSEDTETLDAVIAKIADYVGKDFDVMTVYDDLDAASDDDEILASGAAARLGIDEGDLEPLQDYRLINGDDAPQELLDMLTEAAKGGKKKTAKKAEKPAAKKAAPKKAKAKSDDDAAEAEGAVSAETLQRFKEVCTFKDADMAQAIGVSRATFNNYVNGKSVFEPTADQAATLRDAIVDRLNSLHLCLAELDGTEAHEVF